MSNSRSELEEDYARASFLAIVSHELRTPLHNIQGLIRVLYRDEINAAQRYYLRLIQDASNNLLLTINDVLDFSKANTGMLSVETKPCALLSVVKDALRTVSSKAEDKPELELICSYDTKVPALVHSDAQRIRQILVNLLGNAIKFTSAGFVRLDVEALEPVDGRVVVRFAVTDTGMGIPAEKLRSVFEPFSQVDMTVVRRTQGTGLGLTIVQQLVGLLRGEIGVESTLGKGSTFWFTITAKADGQFVSLGSPLAGHSAHIVSKSTHTAVLLQEILVKQGLDVRCSKQPLSSTEFLQSPSDFLVITDDVLVNESAWHMVQQFIERRGPQAVIPLLGPGALRLRQRCHELRLPICLSLPIVSTDLIEAMCGRYEPEEHEDELQHTMTASEPLNILIADDIPTNELILRLALEEAGHNVRAVNDGRELWNLVSAQLERPGEIAARELFDVVLTDIQMPHMDGITVIKKVRELEARATKAGIPPLPLIAVTAHAFAAEKERILDAGATGMVTKPLNPKDLERVLSTVKRRSERAPTLQSPASHDSASHAHTSCAASVEPASAGTPFSELQSCDTSTTTTSPFLLKAQIILGTDAGVIDVADVFERLGENDRRTLLILRSFLECYEEVLMQLENYEDRLSTQELGKVAHAIKGLVGEVGAKATHALAHSLEKLAKSDRRDELLKGIPTLISDTTRVAAVVQKVVEAFDGSETQLSQESPSLAQGA